ncbi:MAG TPA: BTAD domain-containing putative transcriptional regulator [Candidatus Limnocylindrales bacterium]|nr:BTAD domain-containing putative transcriptional regulator [Candidatus Limnocylindrales bacterium]
MEPRASSIEIRVLGPIELVIDGRDVPLGGPRQRALLALLALPPAQVLGSDILVEEIWAGEPTEGADTTLRSYVSRLRRSLDGAASIERTDRGYVLQAPADAVDAMEFERLAREGADLLARGAARRARERLAEGLSLWRGRPFGEVGGDGALGAAAERLEERRILAVEQRIEADLGLGRASELVDELESLVRQHPFRERLWQHLMLALYRAGRQADALAAYHRARAALDEHLGIEPGEALRDLEAAILRQDVPDVVLPEARHNLPAALTSFVGRETQVAEVLGLVRESRLVTLTGVGGVGKTRLGLEVATRVIDDFADSVTFVDIAPLGDAALLASHVAAALGLREPPGLTPVDGLLEWLRTRDLLIVLDNCEHLRNEAAGLVHRLLGVAPGLRILATSREPLGVPGEVDVPVPPLVLPAADDDVTAARRSEAVRLLLERARAARPRLEDSDEVIATAVAIVADLDGLPLAIELAAARAKALSLAEIATRLDDRFRFLVSWRRLTTARHRTLREAMDWSYELLAPEEQELLARLSVFAGGFTLDAVAAVAADDDDEAALTRIERLVDASLVVPVDEPGGTRYRLLETVRQYGAERLAALGLRDAAIRAHCRYFVALAEAAPERGAEQARGLATLDADLDNVRATLELVVELGDVDAEQRLCARLWRYWWVRGNLTEGRTRVEAALARAPGANTPAYRRLVYGAAGLAWTAGDYERAKTAAAEFLASETVVGGEGVYHAQNLMGVIALKLRDYAAAEHHLLESARLAHEVGDVGDEYVARLNLGNVMMDSGRPEEAAAIFEAVLAYHRGIGSSEGIGFASLNLGEATLRLGDAVQSGQFFEDARVAFGSIGFRAHEGHAIQGLAAVEATAARFDEAATYLGRAEALLSEVGAGRLDFAPDLAETAESLARAAIGDERFAQLFEAGRRQESRR